MADSTSDKDTELTMCDVLEEEQELEDDANAVLGGSDDTNCSYDKGYVPRQALYACKTCAVTGDAGVCLACCLACHEGHEVVELYTKRNFRCDCGNSKFTDKSCTLKPDKEPINAKNNYNHNFKGLYCSCRRPYPDLEDNVPDEMIQCIMCEDWYHGRHLGTKVPEDYFEMICQTCMDSHKFLFSYLNGPHVEVDEGDVKGSKHETAVNGVKSEANSSQSDVPSQTTIKEENCGVESNVNAPADKIKSEVNPQEENEVKTEGIKPEEDDVSSGTNPESKSTLMEEQDIKLFIKVEPTTSGDGDTCALKKLHSSANVKPGSAFWPENWRKELCRCPSCMDLYANNRCEFLLNPDDTIQAYEERGRGHSSQSQYDQGLSALSQLDRVKQMEAVRGYTNMKRQLLEYLKEFADNKRTVCESDIKEFFERMGKKQKLNNGIPHYCR